jgi:peptide/nickel transport system substrate-binding protein
LSTSLPRIFGVFFNQSAAPVLVNKEVRRALDLAVNRPALIQEVLNGWGTPNKSPLPKAEVSSAEGPDTSTLDTAATATDPYIVAAQQILTDNGWKMGDKGFMEKKGSGTAAAQTLAFSISAPNVPEITATANRLKEIWGKLGANVTVQIFEPSDLAQKVIRPRTYDSLLFGQVVGRDFDLYPFWHSSQRNDPGLNIALYTNIKADKALETIRSVSDEAKRLEAYKAFEAEIMNDIPAVFLYSPDYIYAGTNNVRNMDISNITSPSERFMNVSKWYIETDRVWKFFTEQK